MVTYYKDRTLHRVFGSKIQDFFQTFSQNMNLFFQTQGYQIGDQKRPEKSQEQSFFHDALQTYGRDWITFDQNEKNFTSKSTCCSFENNSGLIFIIFPDSVWTLITSQKS